jgi:hypothetical protein
VAYDFSRQVPYDMLGSKVLNVAMAAKANIWRKLIWQSQFQPI